jgi:diguanylate cyclase (GGDEF)-like protein/PAS domain S-box-containing protein
MPAAPLPADEALRLHALYSTGLLDSAPEPAFDRITRLVARALDVPIALISLVDEERQWFKSRVGAEACQTPREQAFCAHAILQTEPLVVPDATADARFADNPLVTGAPDIRAYAGVPIRTRNGQAIGTLCAIDSQPRWFTREELDTLSDLAALAMKQVQMREAVERSRLEVNRFDAALRANAARFEEMFDLASVGMAQVAPDGAWLHVNQALCRIVGYSPDELQRLSFQDITHPDDLHADLDLMRQLRAGQISQFQIEKRYRRKGGRYIWIDLNVTKKSGEDGRVEYFISIIQDIDARKQTELALAALRRNLEETVQQRTEEVLGREAELRMVIENAYDAYVSTDEEGRVTTWNQQAESTFGWSAAEALGQPLENLILPKEMREGHGQGMARYLRTGIKGALDKRLEVPAQRKDGTPLVVELCATALHMHGRTMFSVFLHDITQRKAMEAEREWEARHDALTGLLNRRAFMELLPQALARADRGGKPLALLFLDLDGFKAVNDTLGHEAGDELLRHAGTVLRQSVRQTDSVVRLAGDEFVVVLENLSLSEADGYSVAEKILARLSAPLLLQHGQARVSASIGIAVYAPGSGQTPSALIHEADGWMYQAKQAGKSLVLPRRATCPETP